MHEPDDARLILLEARPGAYIFKSIDFITRLIAGALVHLLPQAFKSISKTSTTRMVISSRKMPCHFRTVVATRYPENHPRDVTIS